MPLTSYMAPLTAADIPALEAVEKETRLALWGLESYRRFLEELPEYFGYKTVVADDSRGEILAGFYLARSVFENLEILKVGVFPMYQRQGLGTQLMDSAYAEGIKRGCRRCFLEVRKSNRAAIQFYQDHKFKFAGTRINYYSDPVEDAWIMERLL